MSNLSERLTRLEEQNIELPAPEMMEHLGVWYAVWNDEGELMYWEELAPEIFLEFPVVCFGGYMNAFELGRMH